MSDHTRADEGEGREPGQIAYEAWVEREWELCQLIPWARLSDRAKADWAHIEQKSAAQAEAEVARLRERMATLEAALKLCLTELDWQLEQTNHCGDPNYECPLQDARKPSDSHAEARSAARTALEAPHAEN